MTREKMTDGEIETLRTKKIVQCEKIVDLAARNMAILNKLSTQTTCLTEADFKTYRLSIYMPQKRRHDAAVAKLAFWKDESQVRDWLTATPWFSREPQSEIEEADVH